MDRIQPYIVAAHRGDVSRVAEMDAEMVSYAKAEIARLHGKRGHLTIIDCCHESKTRCAALERIVAALENSEASV